MGRARLVRVERGSQIGEVKKPRKPLKSDPAKQAAWQARGAKKYQDKVREQGRKALPKTNPKRKKALNEKQFGEKAAWHRQRTGVCDVTGLHPTEMWPLEVAHVGHPDRAIRRAGHGTRGNGANSTYTLLLRKDAHQRFDQLDEAKYEEYEGWSKTAVRELAVTIHEVYLRQRRESGLDDDPPGSLAEPV